jgi:hypothetical protein
MHACGRALSSALTCTGSMGASGLGLDPHGRGLALACGAAPRGCFALVVCSGELPLAMLTARGLCSPRLTAGGLLERDHGRYSARGARVVHPARVVPLVHRACCQQWCDEGRRTQEVLRPRPVRGVIFAGFPADMQVESPVRTVAGAVPTAPPPGSDPGWITLVEGVSGVIPWARLRSRAKSRCG